MGQIRKPVCRSPYRPSSLQSILVLPLLLLAASCHSISCAELIETLQRFFPGIIIPLDAPARPARLRFPEKNGGGNGGANDNDDYDGADECGDEGDGDDSSDGSAGGDMGGREGDGGDGGQTLSGPRDMPLPTTVPTLLDTSTRDSQDAILVG